jgi:hypothetical protein
MWSFISRRSSFLRTIELNFFKLLFGGGGGAGGKWGMIYLVDLWFQKAKVETFDVTSNWCEQSVNIFVVKHDGNITKFLDPTTTNGFKGYLGWYMEEQALKELNPNTFVC